MNAKNCVPALRESVREVFQAMMGLNVTPADPVALAWPPLQQYTSMIGLAGEVSGLIYFICGQPLACLVTSSMLGMEIAENDPSITDALGEVANMVGGSLKNKVPEFMHNRLSLPSVVSGSDFEIHIPGGRDEEVAAFETNGHPFILHLILKNAS